MVRLIISDRSYVDIYYVPSGKLVGDITTDGERHKQQFIIDANMPIGKALYKFRDKAMELEK